MTTLGLIGAGHIGSQLARLGVAYGYNVIVSNSRGPETLAELVDELGPSARAATVADAARSSDLVVVTMPLKNIGTLPADAFDGKTVMDTNNYYPQRDGQIAVARRRDHDGVGAAAGAAARRARREGVQQHLRVRDSPPTACPRATRTAVRSPSRATTQTPRPRSPPSSTASASTWWMPVRSRKAGATRRTPRPTVPRLTAAELREALASAKRYRDM